MGRDLAAQADGCWGGIQFTLKTGLDWAERITQPPVEGKYTFVRSPLALPPPVVALNAPHPKRRKLQDCTKLDCTGTDELHALLSLMFDEDGGERELDCAGCKPGTFLQIFRRACGN